MALAGVSALGLLDVDPDPIFVLSGLPASRSALAVFNNALRNDKILHEKLRAIILEPSLEFCTWVKSAHTDEAEWAGHVWTGFAVGDCTVVRSRGRAVIKKSSPTTLDGAGDAAATAEDSYENRLVKIDSQVDSKSPTQLLEIGGHIIASEHFLEGSSNVRMDTLMRMMQMSDWFKLSGHPRDPATFLPFSFMDVVYAEDTDLVMAQWQKATQGKALSFEMRWRSQQQHKDRGDGPDADAQWVLCACVPIYDSEGNLVSVAGNTIDITAQKHAIFEASRRNEALERARASEHRFAKFAQLAPIAIYIFDAQKGMQYCNDQYFDLTNIPRREFSEVDWSVAIFEEDLPTVLESWRELLDDKKPSLTQFRLRNRKWQGVPAWIQAISYPETAEDGSITSIMGTLVDISQFKWAESLQKRQTEEALEAKRQQENFIDMTSHELRNPLSAVVQCADSTVTSLTDMLNIVCELITGDDANISHAKKLDELRKEIQSSLDNVATIISCSTHQTRIIDDVLTLSKLDSSLLLITPLAVDPSTVVADACKMFQVECQKSKINLDFHVDASLEAEVMGAWVMVDPSRLNQILINLLTNAIKFTRNRPVRAINVTLGASSHRPTETWHDITFMSTRDPQTSGTPGLGTGLPLFLWISVQDTGCGLSPTQQSNLFTRFSQATPRTHVQYGGSGLGLFISRSLAELQGGEIGVRSSEGSGSTFSFFITTRKTEPVSPDVILDGDVSRKRTALDLEDDFKNAHLSVLIVEDNITNQRVLAKQLTKLGCNVHIADHGQAAIEFLKKSQYWKGLENSGVELAIVLMDIEMPVMNGMECVRAIRKYQIDGDITNHVPILAVSANARSEQVQQALKAGMDDAIAKPFRIPELLPKLDRLAKKRLLPTL